MHPALALPRHVAVCRDDAHVVFLDVRQDRYWTLPVAVTRGFGECVSNWPLPADSGAASERVLRLLVERRLLVDEAGADLQRERCQSVLPPRLELPPATRAPPAKLVHATGTLLIAAATVFALRCGSLERVTERLRQRKLRRSEHFTVAAASALETCASLTALFEIVRPALFSPRDHCLFDSLVLIEYLAWHRVHPLLVFGVQAAPFAAHCWVQHGDVVLNDSVEHVSRYTPILAL